VDHEGQSFNEHHVTGRDRLSDIVPTLGFKFWNGSKRNLDEHVDDGRQADQESGTTEMLNTQHQVSASVFRAATVFLEDSWPSRVIADDDHMLRIFH